MDWTCQRADDNAAPGPGPIHYTRNNYFILHSHIHKTKIHYVWVKVERQRNQWWRRTRIARSRQHGASAIREATEVPSYIG
jgi:hypothetical protein